MARGIKLFHVLGIQIAIDYSWFLVFALFGWSLSYGYFPHYTPGLSDTSYLVMGFSSSLLIFVCVLIHELAHSYVSNTLGLPVKKITLFIFGGVAELSKEPDDASTELKIAIAGPIASALLALLFYFLAKVASTPDPSAAEAMLTYLALVNSMLCIFNLIPAFPLDGGRILRALWWGYSKDLNGATRAASRIGIGFALMLTLFGFIQIFSGNIIGGLWAVLIGFFIQRAAESGYRQTQYKQTLSGILVQDIMSKKVVCIPCGLTLKEAIDKYFLTYHHVSFPVVSGTTPVGLLTLAKIRQLGHSVWNDTTVKEAMEPLSDTAVLRPEAELTEAIKVIAKGPLGRATVIEGERIVGVLTRADVMRLLELKSIFKE